MTYRSLFFGRIYPTFFGCSVMIRSAKTFALAVFTGLILLGSVNICAQSAANDSLLHLLETETDDSVRSGLLLIIASSYEDERPDTSLQIMRKAYGFAQLYDDLDWIALIQCRMANIMSFQGRTDSAAVYIMKAIKLSHQTGNDRRMAMAYLTMGMNMGILGDKQGSLEYSRKASTYYLKAKAFRPLAGCLMNMMYGFGELQMLDSVKHYFEQVIPLLDSVDMFNGKFGAYTIMGMVHQKSEHYELAGKFFRDALEFQEDTNDSYHQAEYHRLVGRNYRMLGQYDSAEEHLNTAFRIHMTNGTLPGLFETAHEYCLLYEDSEDLAKAVEYWKKYDIYRDSFRMESKGKAMDELRIKYEAERKEQENSLLQKTAQIQELQLLRRNGFIFVLILSLVLVAAIAFVVYKRIRFKAEESELRMEQKVLRSQMNPHFVFNALSSIQHIVYNNDRLFAVTNISIFAKLMRRVLEHSGRERITVEDEAETLRLYIALEALRFDQSFHYEVSIAPNFDAQSVFIPPVLIQPYVENAIKHGLLNKTPQGGNLDVQFRMEGHDLLCIVEDDGVGRTRAGEIRTSVDPEHRSFSSASIMKRVKLINKRRKENIVIHIEDLTFHGKASGTRVVIRIPQTELTI